MATTSTPEDGHTQPDAGRVPELAQATGSAEMTCEVKIARLAKLLMSEPWTLVACGIGDIKGEDLAKRLLCLASHPQPDPSQHTICHTCDGRGFHER